MTAIMERRAMEMPWLKSYPPGVPAQIDASQYGSIRDIFAISCRRYAQRPAFTNMGRTISYADLDRLSAGRLEAARLP